MYECVRVCPLLCAVMLHVPSECVFSENAHSFTHDRSPVSIAIDHASTMHRELLIVCVCMVGNVLSMMPCGG